MAKKNLVNLIAYYWIIGILFGMYKALEFKIKFGAFATGKTLATKFVVATFFYPVQIILEYGFGIILDESIWLIIGAISMLSTLLYLYVWRRIVNKKQVEVKHIVLNTLFTLLVIVSFSVNANYNQQEILRNNNYRNILLDYESRTSGSDLDYYQGFALDKYDINVFFVDDAFMESTNRTYPDVSLLGLYSAEDNAIYINTEKIRSRSRTDDDYYKQLEIVFLHEITHYLDGINYLRDADNVYGFNYSTDYSGLVITNSNQQHFIDLVDDYTYDMPYNVKNHIDFDWVFSQKSNYEPYQYRNEVIARVNSVCIELDASNNLNKVKKSDYRFCDSFNFPKYYLQNYDLFLEDFVINYVDTFQFGSKDPLKIEKGVTE